MRIGRPSCGKFSISVRIESGRLPFVELDVFPEVGNVQQPATVPCEIAGLGTRERPLKIRPAPERSLWRVSAAPHFGEKELALHPLDAEALGAFLGQLGIVLMDFGGSFFSSGETLSLAVLPT